MKKIKEFIRDFEDNNPWLVAIAIFAAFIWGCHWLGTHFPL